MNERFQHQWFGLVLLAAGAFAVYHGMRIVVRREIDNPLLTLRGPRALALGLAVVAVGIGAAVLGLREGFGAG